jgi:hypothetical protein
MALHYGAIAYNDTVRALDHTVHAGVLQMTRLRFILSSLLIAIVAVSLAAHNGRRAAATPLSLDARTIEFSYQVHFPATPGVTGPVHLWIPAPTRIDSYQTPASAMSITENVKHTMSRDPEYGDEFIVFDPAPEQVASGFDAGMRFTVQAGATHRRYRRTCQGAHSWGEHAG